MFKITSIKKGPDLIVNLVSYLLLLVTPLIFVTNTKELFEFPKMFFVYITGSTLIFVFTLKILHTKKLSLIPPGRLPSLFVLTNILATLFSTHFYTSLWGYYSRFNGGLVSILIFFGIYWVLKNQGIQKTFWYIPIVTIIPIAIYGIHQHFQEITRVYSTIGQPNWLAAYIAMVLPSVVWAAINSDAWPCSINKLIPRICLFAIYVLGFTTLWYTYSLSGLLGFVASMLVFTILNKKPLRKKSTLRFYLGILGVSILIALLNPGIFKQRIEDVKTDVKNIIAQRTHVHASETNHNLSDPGVIRTGIWKGTLKLIFADPKNFLIGIGPETFPYEFQKYRPAQLNYSSEWDFILNKPHNYYLEILTETGALGLISYSLLLMWSIKKRHPFITSSLTALYITNIFSWPVVPTNLLFWVFLAMLEEKA